MVFFVEKKELFGCWSISQFIQHNSDVNIQMDISIGKMKLLYDREWYDKTAKSFGHWHLLGLMNSSHYWADFWRISNLNVWAVHEIFVASKLQAHKIRIRIYDFWNQLYKLEKQAVCRRIPEKIRCKSFEIVIIKYICTFSCTR